MAMRTTESLVTFRRPFLLSGLEERQAAGTYRVVIDEAEIEGISFLAWQRVATMIHVPAITVRTGARQVFQVDADELAEAISADAR